MWEKKAKITRDRWRKIEMGKECCKRDEKVGVPCVGLEAECDVDHELRCRSLALND